MEKFEFTAVKNPEPVVQPVSDEQKQITKTKTVEVVENFTVVQRKAEIAAIDNQIAQLQARQAGLQADIDGAVSELELSVEVK